jgi:hypothetical protein
VKEFCACGGVVGALRHGGAQLENALDQNMIIDLSHCT